MSHLNPEGQAGVFLVNRIVEAAALGASRPRSASLVHIGLFLTSADPSNLKLKPLQIYLYAFSVRRRKHLDRKRARNCVT